MQESERMAKEAKKRGEELAGEVRKFGQEAQEARQSDFEAASRSFSEASKGFQAIAAEMTNYSKKSIDEVVTAWEQLLSARSLPEVIDIQTRYAKRAYETYMASFSEITDRYLDLTRQTKRPVEQTMRRYS